MFLLLLLSAIQGHPNELIGKSRETYESGIENKAEETIVTCASCEFLRGDQDSTHGSGRASIRWYSLSKAQSVRSHKFRGILEDNTAITVGIPWPFPNSEHSWRPMGLYETYHSVS